ncbi:erythromycin esterase-like protein [Chitinophaga polysaccharea]|uniref:Erythromycin esterase-like protein n=1 Tax=Chitinophaga polysaccharea TaxID=1293035 RepID=A0A561P9M8_9BACT|nr:erythromycin esterase family protein [Chitinophaga polysaccharea]TWF34834.1 erythromycin esterase-like protein [Chitinophaga polysaccharea]
MDHYFKHTLDTTVSIADLHRAAHPFTKGGNLDLLIDKIGHARVVMLGEASHGNHEYYKWRNYISQRLIAEKGFNFIAVEGDWPDCYRFNRYIKHYDQSGSSAFNVLHSFNRWPTWMWANWEITALGEWLYNYNVSLSVEKKIGFYGLDVYSLWESMEAILAYLRKEDPAMVSVAEEAYQCFEPYRTEEGHGYARATALVPELCKTEVVNLLRDIRQRFPHYDTDHESAFSTEQNALVAVHAENYYSAMIKGGPHSWNIRDLHMEETLERLLQFHGGQSKAIIWAHNTHIGDARATDMASEGMVNIGELARAKFGEHQVALVGFGAYQGHVIAGKRWGARMANMTVPPAQTGSWEYLLRNEGDCNKWFLMDDLRNTQFLEVPVGHRAIGVVYHPEYERYGNYVPSILPLRYDAFIYLDHVTALHPLHIKPDGTQMPETYPFGV